MRWFSAFSWLSWVPVLGGAVLAAYADGEWATVGVALWLIGLLSQATSLLAILRLRRYYG
jgi:hypothetical protein